MKTKVKKHTRRTKKGRRVTVKKHKRKIKKTKRNVVIDSVPSCVWPIREKDTGRILGTTSDPENFSGLFQAKVENKSYISGVIKEKRRTNKSLARDIEKLKQLSRTEDDIMKIRRRIRSNEEDIGYLNKRYFPRNPR